MFSKVKTFLQGKKTYIMAGVGLVSVLMAWAEGQISGTAALASAWGALQTCFIRAGIDNAAKKAADSQ
jgi:hypothetical protein